MIAPTDTPAPLPPLACLPRLQAIFRCYCTVALAAYRKRGGPPSSKPKDGGGGSGGGGSGGGGSGGGSLLGGLAGVGSPGGSPGGGDDGAKPVDVSRLTIDLQEWLTFLTDANALGGAGNLNEKQATTFFTRADLADDDIGAAAAAAGGQGGGPGGGSGGGPAQGGNDAAEALTYDEFSDAVARAALQYTKGLTKEFGAAAAARVRAFLSMVMASPAALCLKKPKRPSAAAGAAAEPSSAPAGFAAAAPVSPASPDGGGGVPAAPTPGPALARELDAAGVQASRRAGGDGATRQ